MILYLHVPIKRKYIRGNNSTLMTKDLRARIMQIPKHTQHFCKRDLMTLNSSKIGNKVFVSTFYKKRKKQCLKQLNNKVVSDNRQTWQKINPLLLGKVFCKETITLKDNKRTITNIQKLAGNFNTFYSNITQNLKIDGNLVEITQNLNTTDPVLKAIKKPEKYPSIIKIKEKLKNKKMFFSFSFVTKKIILNELRKLNNKKASRKSGIPVKIIK